MSQSVLTASQARKYYNRFGKWQDTQGFYEDPALDELVVHAGFEKASRVLEFGCGTGKFAGRLLARHLPPSATYLGCDVSPTMVELATRRLAPYAPRAEVVQSDGAVHFPVADESVDVVVSTYVLDLLSETDGRLFFAEAYRVLAPGGKLCLVSLTTGISPTSRVVSRLWTAVFHLRPSLVGGCRPVRLEDHVDTDRWQHRYRNVLTAFAVPSEIVVLGKMGPR